MSILVVAAHPDDEILGCGGTMARHAAAGDRVEILILGEGSTSRSISRDVQAHGELLSGLKDAARAAAKAVGASGVRFGDLPDNRFDEIALIDIVKHVEAAKARTRPSIIYTHHGADLNIDHRLTQQAVLTAFRPQPGETYEGLFAFEVNSSTEWQSTDYAPPFLPDHFVDISAQLGTKLEALRCYHSEMREFPHSRSLEAIEALARFSGAQVGMFAAERFRTLRTLRRSDRDDNV